VQPNSAARAMARVSGEGSLRGGRRRSRKGEREALRILEAATTSLARDGFAGATLGRIAAEADVDKAMVLYYFGSREELLGQVVKWLGERAAAQAEEALEAVSSVLGPGPVAAVGVQALWDSSLAVPELPRAYMALLTGSRHEEVRVALRELKARYMEIFRKHVAALEAQGYELKDDLEGYITLVFAILRGLVLEWAEDGDTPQLQASLDGFKAFAGSRFARRKRSKPSRSN
jgi:TetR/AcrR family transcriptional regulator, cholesterol catabolism regulator